MAIQIDKLSTVKPLADAAMHEANPDLETACAEVGISPVPFSYVRQGDE
ncbi:MAG: hypothetical protein KZQ95_14890 [Candidatus Thiodiazotropha sp. (ex Epidulcina cf. delphinae)]|nr:hypothetical protein [Candidatus Thiodiazotropha sp. (ex Epidulcina cf. delphinae)]